MPFEITFVTILAVDSAVRISPKWRLRFPKKYPLLWMESCGYGEHITMPTRDFRML
jgi:hypothetical protein